MGEITLPLSTCKKFLIENGQRASPEAVKLFHDKLVVLGREAAKVVQAKAEEAKRKTIQAEDFN